MGDPGDCKKIPHGAPCRQLLTFGPDCCWQNPPHKQKAQSCGSEVALTESKARLADPAVVPGPVSGPTCRVKGTPSFSSSRALLLGKSVS